MYNANITYIYIYINDYLEDINSFQFCTKVT